MNLECFCYFGITIFVVVNIVKVALNKRIWGLLIPYVINILSTHRLLRK